MNLVEARKAARYTQQDIADNLGISRQTYLKMEQEPESITISDAKKIAAFLEVDVSDIFFCSDCN